MTRSFYYLSIALFIKGLIALLLILYYGIGLSPDEAQYWLWAKHLDWGYYSKPPGIAWLLYLSTAMIGNSVLGVRIVALFFSTLISLLMYRFASVCGGSSRLSFWAGMVMAFSPVGILSTFAATTDGGFLCFWILACTVVARALKEKKALSIARVGFLIGCGVLFKWTMLIFWGVLVAYFICKKVSRGWGLGVMWSFIGFIPSLIWNSQREWPTFKHVFFHNLLGSQSIASKSFNTGNFWDFFGVQFAILSPLFFALLLWSWYFLFKKKENDAPQWRFCGWSSLLFLGLYMFASLFTKIQPNWALFALPTGVIWMLYILTKSSVKLGYFSDRIRFYGVIGTILSILLSVLVLSVPLLQREKIGKPIPWKLNIFRPSLGWEALTPQIEKWQGDYLFSDTYQMASILSFYSPNQKRAYLLNLQNRRKNQFEYWRQWENVQTNDKGLFIAKDNNTQYYENELLKYFQYVEYLGAIPLFYCYGKPVKVAFAFSCKEFKGKLPPKESKY